jgi:sugar porter (SP) family MFS transporter
MGTRTKDNTMQSTEERLASTAVQYRMAYIWMICLVAAMGGLLFGYDWVVIGGAKPFFERYFELTTAGQKGWANSCALIGCLFGAIVSGALSDKFGRKRLLVLAAFLFTVTSIGTALAGIYFKELVSPFGQFVIWRLLGGTAIGLASNLSPMYIAEVSPPKLRGMFVSVNQLTIVIGVFSAQLVNYLIAQIVERLPEHATDLEILNSWVGQTGWRWMFGVTAVPSFLFLVFMFLVPESPRWLAKNGKAERSRAVLAKIGGDAYSRRAFAEIDATLVNDIERVDFRELLDPRMLKILTLGIVLAVFQQWCGINTLFNYAEEIFAAAGYGINQTLLNIVATGAVCLVFTFVAIFTADRLGRKWLMLIGAAGLSLLYLVLGKAYLSHWMGTPVLAVVLGAMACYSCTLAPIVWVILSEIFPNRIRGAAMSVSVSALWIGCFTLTYYFPPLKEALGMGHTFWIYSAICAAGFLYVLLCLPETKGKSLEELERALM